MMRKKGDNLWFSKIIKLSKKYNIEWVVLVCL